MNLDFLTLHPEALGLDLSDLSLKIAKLKKTRTGFRLVSFGSFPVPPGLITQGDIKKEEELLPLIQKALREVRGEKFSTKHVIASLPEEKAFVQVIQLPKMRPQDVVSAVAFESENYIPYPLETVYLDSEILDPLKDSLDHTDALVASLPRAVVDSYVSLLERAGLVPLALEIESLAAARALVPHHIASVPLLVIDCGATRTSFIIFAGKGVRFTASIGISSSQFTQAIARDAGIDLAAAEQLKKTHGLRGKTTKEGQKVFEALAGPLKDLVGQIKKYMDFYESHADHQHLLGDEKRIQHIVLSGGGANLPGFKEFLSKELKVEVALGNPWVNIFSPQHTLELPPISLQESLGYATALGLALRGAQAPHDFYD